jgi:hypothetical protein
VTLAELQALVHSGEVMAKPDDVEPWVACHLARATWYRQAAAGDFDSFVRRLGRSYRILLRPYLAWLGETPGP